MAGHRVWRAAKHGRPAACAARLNCIVPDQIGCVCSGAGKSLHPPGELVSRLIPIVFVSFRNTIRESSVFLRKLFSFASAESFS